MDRTRDAEFTAYVRANGPNWERYAYALTGDAQQAKDLLQSVLLTAYRRWSRIVGLEHPDAYIRRMVTNGYLDWRRRRRNSEVPTGEIDEARAGPDLAIGVVDRDELQRALTRLSPHQRAVLVLRHLQGRSDEEIAAVLGCSVGTVRTHASRGQRRVRDALLATTTSRESP